MLVALREYFSKLNIDKNVVYVDARVLSFPLLK